MLMQRVGALVVIHSGAHVVSADLKRLQCGLQAAASADGPPAAVKVFGKGSKSAPAFGLAALSWPRTPPAEFAPAMPPATAQIGAAVGSSAPPSIAAPGSVGVATSPANGEGAAAAPEASAMGKRRRESENG